MLENQKKIHNILIVDDSVDHVEVVVELFNLLGYATTGALSGESALEKIANHAPDIAFIDLVMLGMDGFSLARAIRSNPAHAGLILVALTGSNNPEMLRLAKEADFSAFLLKPISIDAIISNIQDGTFNKMHDLRKSISIAGLDMGTSVFNSCKLTLLT